MPKGVMWSHAELFRAMGNGGNAVLGFPPVRTLDEIGPAVAARTNTPVVLEACPLINRADCCHLESAF